MKFDLPEPFGPIRRLIGRSSSFSTDARLLNPSIVTKSSAFEGIVFGGLACGR